MAEIRYDGQVVVVTGAGSGLGREYARFFASKGAKVVVNDLGGSVKGEGSNSSAADIVTSSINAAGGIAIANHDSVVNGERIIAAAIQAFGRIDILINNAGILRDITLKNMTDTDWDTVIDVHLTGTYRTTRAAWPFFRKQKYGRVVNTSSSSGLYGNFGQSNYAAAKLAIVGFTQTLAKEGAKYNIHANVIAPAAASRMTQTVWPPEMLDMYAPTWVVPLVGALVHTSCAENGALFEAAAGHFSKIRWQRSPGVMLRPDEKFGPDALLEKWEQVGNYKSVSTAERPRDVEERLQMAWMMEPNRPRGKMSFVERVVLVTGGGAGLGKAYAELFGKLGAKVVVNDLKGAEDVAAGIKADGGEAVAIVMSVEKGEEVVKAVLDAYGRIDIIVNNAGILRDKAFQNMTDDLWNPVLNVHLRGTYKVTKAAWPHMIKQQYGRIVNITSTSGIYGNFGQANYAAAKCGMIGFTRAIAQEGAKYNIFCNAVAPVAGTAMTATVSAPEIVDAMKPEYVAPLIAVLCSNKCPTPNGGLYEAGVAWFAATRWERARGVDFPIDDGVPKVEANQALSEICNFSNNQTDHPANGTDSSKYSMANIMRSSLAKTLPSNENRANRKYIAKIAAAMALDGPPGKYTYTDRDSILYNLSLGAKRTALPFVYENDENFQVLPTIGVIPPYKARSAYNMADILPNFNPRLLVHGEQYFEVHQYPVPTAGTLKTSTKLLEVVDKGNAALVRRSSTTVDASTGNTVFYGESVAFVRGAGGFGGAKTVADRGAATAANKPPGRAPDSVVEERTGEEQAVLYRLMGDRNPLHIDPAFSKVGGFEVPILHGLCTFGISAKHVLQTYGPYRNIKVRFASPVLPGQTIVTEMWKEGGKVIFQTKVKENGKLCISAAAAELMQGAKASL
ncbi:multifunctional beta-oxidation protein-like protein [Microthyrium microscopicum]|uniref:Multifunctional beta-oxidation protein-like protein n=1 Tax=Microthyrium microscopicum TaxID=703497 RepID=A0A6A6UE49_9PEZI|nr:multifunctional beta-oxidation protein-like protein [Microthyrium microscopicum]